MPQLHLSVDERTAKELAARAAARGESLSKCLAGLVRREIAPRWPSGYLTAVVGSCAGVPLGEPQDPPPDDVYL